MDSALKELSHTELQHEAVRELTGNFNDEKIWIQVPAD